MIGRRRRQPGGKERRREVLARHCPSVSFRAYASSPVSSFLLALYRTVPYRTTQGICHLHIACRFKDQSRGQCRTCWSSVRSPAPALVPRQLSRYPALRLDPCPR